MTINKLTVALTLLACAPLVGAMQALDESELNQVTGEGLGAAFDNVVIASPDYGQPGAFSIKLNLTEDGPEALKIGELRFHRSRNEIERKVGENDSDYIARVQRTGGRFGTYDDPYVTNTLKNITDVYGNERTALSTAWPAAHLKQKERSFFNYTASNFDGWDYLTTTQTGAGIGGMNRSNGSTYYRGLPRNFFHNVNNVDVGNLYTLARQYDDYLKDHDAQLDVAANKFDLHLRVDAITAENAERTGLNDHFVAYVDAIGARLYGTENTIWAQEGRGLAMSMTLGLVADELRITSSPDGAIGSQLSFKGLDAYVPQGSADQPMTISTVQFRQVQRGKWKEQTMDTELRTQMRVEVAALPADAIQAKRGHIFVQSIGLGDPNDPEIITGVEDIYLRNESGTIIDTVKDVKHRAFVPKTVIYNEQVDNYNKLNNANLPNIPNQNVIEIRGLEIQRMVMTTQDLGR